MKPEDVHKLEQSLAAVSENLPPMYKRLYDNLLAQGFDKDEAFKILLVQVNAMNNGTLRTQ